MTSQYNETRNRNYETVLSLYEVVFPFKFYMTLNWDNLFTRIPHILLPYFIYSLSFRVRARNDDPVLERDQKKTNKRNYMEIEVYFLIKFKVARF